MGKFGGDSISTAVTQTDLDLFLCDVISLRHIVAAPQDKVAALIAYRLGNFTRLHFQKPLVWIVRLVWVFANRAA